MRRTRRSSGFLGVLRDPGEIKHYTPLPTDDPGIVTGWRVDADRPVHIILGYPPGGGTDLVALRWLHPHRAVGALSR